MSHNKSQGFLYVCHRDGGEYTVRSGMLRYLFVCLMKRSQSPFYYSIRAIRHPWRKHFNFHQIKVNIFTFLLFRRRWVQVDRSWWSFYGVQRKLLHIRFLSDGGNHVSINNSLKVTDSCDAKEIQLEETNNTLMEKLLQ